MTKGSLLIVEDERIVAADLEDRLLDLGYTVCARVASAEEALEIVANENPDLVLMDIKLEGKMDGIEAAQIIKETSNIPVIFLTAYSDEKMLERGKLSEPYGYLVKPYREADLHATIEMALYKAKVNKELLETKVALEKVQVELENREEMRRKLLHQVVWSQEDDRRRIARELHDETAQTLTATVMNLEALKSFVPDQAKVVDMIHTIQTQIQKMNDGIYRLIHDLRPLQLENLGLVSSLKNICEEIPNLAVTFSVHGKSRKTSSVIEIVVFRAIQEALTNIVKYAETDKATVDLTYDNDRLVLEIVDKGRGFNIQDSESRKKGYGLVGIQERVESVGGEMILASGPGQGTQLEIVVPRKERFAISSFD